MDKPTHRLSNTLDLIIHDADSNIIPRIKVDGFFSDHNIVLFDISTPCTVTNSKVQVYRSSRTSTLLSSWKMLRNSVLKNLLDYLLMIRQTTITQCFKQFWTIMLPSKATNVLTTIRFPGSMKGLPRPSDSKGTLRGTWHRDRSNVEAFTLFHHQHQPVSNLLDKAEWEFFLTSITENSLNYKWIYDICNHLLGRTKDSPLPPGITNKDLTNKFNKYFIEKTVKICTDLIGKHQQLLMWKYQSPKDTELQQFSTNHPS